ncbi:MAG: MFS transporter [Patescibacteria group bacterium]
MTNPKLFTPQTLRRHTYIAVLFLTLNGSLVSYINSSFLSQLVGEKAIGWIYIVASLITIAGFWALPFVLRKNDLRQILLITTMVMVTATGLLGLVAQPTAILIAIFCIFYIAGALARYVLDLYLENISVDKVTGGIWGLFLTIINVAWLASPLLAGFMLNGTANYQLVYLGATVIALPLFAIIIWGLTKQSIKNIPPVSPVSSFAILFKPQSDFDRDIKNIISIDLLLNFFYSLMVVYTPIYLYQHIGLSWDQIGLVFTVMLLPFVLLDYPLGLLADKKIGEKEILVGGLVIMGLATIALSFISGAGLAVWASLLFITRIGAASVEVAKEIYLFKRITPGDTSILSLSRMMVSFSYIIGPALATVFLAFFDFRFIFLALGIIVLLGLRPALALIDTR